MINSQSSVQAGRHAALWCALHKVICAALLSSIIVACSPDHILKVDDPDVAQPSQLSGKESLPTQLAGAIGDFQVAYSGTGNGPEGLVNIGGLLTDEFEFTESFPTRIVIDQRKTHVDRNNSTLRDIYFNAQRARVSAERASDQYNQFDPGAADHAEALNILGYSDLMLAESYCSGVAFTETDADGNFSNTTPLTTPQMLTIAAANFDSALTIATAAGDAEQEQLARVGKARTLVDMGRSNLAEAAATVQSVADDFQYFIFHSTNSSRQYNGVWELMWNEGRWGQSDNEGTNGLPFRSAGDPRTPFEDLGRGFSQGTRLFGTDKYASRDSNVLLASGIEARLIEAEAALDGGDVPGWLGMLNALRANSGLALTPLADPGTPDGRVKLMFSERAFWLYATGHRLGDLRRMARAVANGGYGFPAESVFPTGTWFFAGKPASDYGTDVNLPIPIEEDNNPDSNAKNPGGCIDELP